MLYITLIFRSFPLGGIFYYFDNYGEIKDKVNAFLFFKYVFKLAKPLKKLYFGIILKLQKSEGIVQRTLTCPLPTPIQQILTFCYINFMVSFLLYLHKHTHNLFFLNHLREDCIHNVP